MFEMSKLRSGAMARCHRWGHSATFPVMPNCRHLVRCNLDSGGVLPLGQTSVAPGKGGGLSFCRVVPESAAVARQ